MLNSCRLIAIQGIGFQFGAIEGDRKVSYFLFKVSGYVICSTLLHSYCFLISIGTLYRQLQHISYFDFLQQPIHSLNSVFLTNISISQLQNPFNSFCHSQFPFCIDQSHPKIYYQHVSRWPTPLQVQRQFITIFKVYVYLFLLSYLRGGIYFRFEVHGQVCLFRIYRIMSVCGIGIRAIHTSLPICCVLPSIFRGVERYPSIS